MSSKTYGVLLVGGMRSHQENYALQFQADPRCRLVAVADQEDAPIDRVILNQALADELDLPYQNLEVALERTDVDIVSLCPEVERRAEIAVRCAQAGKHLYLDKPLALNSSSASKIVSAVHESGVKAQMFSNVHCNWAKEAKTTLEEGEIGQLRAIHCDITFAKGHPGSVKQERRIESGKRSRYTFAEAKPELFDIGVYAVSVINWITNQPVKSLVATTGNYFFKEHLAYDVEDFGSIIMELADGTTATISSGRFGWTSHPLGGIQRIKLVGNTGIVDFDANQPRLEVHAAEPSFQPPVPHPLDPMGMWSSTTNGIMQKNRWKPISGQNWIEEEFRSFIDAIDIGTPIEMTVELAAQSVEVITAAYHSAASGQTVNIT